MQLVHIGNSTYVNLDALAFIEPDRGSIGGDVRLRVVFASGTETRLTGRRAETLLGHLEALAAEPLPAPGLAVPAEEHLE